MAPKLRPTLLDLVKSERSLGTVGEWVCPAHGCGKVFGWRADFSREIAIGDECESPYTQARLQDSHSGFLLRVQQEVEQHNAAEHPAEEQGAVA